MVAVGMKKRRKPMAESLALSPVSQTEFERTVKRTKKTMVEDDSKGGTDVIKPNVRLSNVIYLGHIPHGFYESQMRSYFSQFGTVLDVQLARSKVTGASKGYAFVRFESQDVARIAAETMNNYLMFEHILKCNVIPLDKVSPKWFQGDSRRILPGLKRKAAIQAPEKTDLYKGTEKSKRQKIVKMVLRTAKTLKKMGIAFDVTLLLPPIEKSIDSTSKETTMKKKNRETAVLEESSESVPADTIIDQSEDIDDLSLNDSDLYGDDLVIDTSDYEITFKVPPNTKTLRKTKRKKQQSPKSSS